MVGYILKAELMECAGVSARDKSRMTPQVFSQAAGSIKVPLVRTNSTAMIEAGWHGVGQRCEFSLNSVRGAHKSGQ